MVLELQVARGAVVVGRMGSPTYGAATPATQVGDGVNTVYELKHVATEDIQSATLGPRERAPGWRR